MAEQVNFKSLFENAPGLYLILKPNLEIVAASDAYLSATMTKRDEITGKWLFDIFPDDPNDPEADGVSNLRASLHHVIINKEAHTMAVQKYNIRREDGTFEVRFWSPLNKPVLGDNGELQYIIHCVKDLTKETLSEIGRKKTDLLLQASIESMRDTIILFIDSEYRYLDFNSSHREATKAVYGIEITKGMSLLSHMTDPLDREKAKHNFDRALKGESHTTIEEYGQVERYFYETRYNPIINEKNEIIGATAFAINITERKRAEEELVETNKFLDTILDNIPNMLFVKNATDLKFVRLNNAGEKILGIKREELIGKNDYELFPQQEADLFVKRDLALLTNGKLLDVVEEEITTSQGVKWLHTQKILLTAQEGEPLYLLGISEDITYKKRSEEKIIEINAKLEVANQELEAFSYSVSHDLKAPLRSLQGFSKALLETYLDKFDADGKRWLEFIESNSKRMGLLIDDILHFSKVNRTDLRMEDIKMTELIQEVFEAEKLYYPDKKIDIKLPKLLDAYGDQPMLRQVCQNLISNALKYSSKKENIVIKVDSYIENGFQMYSISDNGAGFDEKYKNKMFVAFQRLHANDEFDGTGVGLAIVQRILQKHGGFITATSELGKGSTFTFALPIKNQFI